MSVIWSTEVQSQLRPVSSVKLSFEFTFCWRVEASARFWSSVQLICHEHWMWRPLVLMQECSNVTFQFFLKVPLLLVLCLPADKQCSLFSGSKSATWCWTMMPEITENLICSRTPTYGSSGWTWTNPGLFPVSLKASRPPGGRLQ